MSGPVVSMTAMPASVHGARPAASSAVSACPFPKPSSRKSTIAMVPIDIAKPMKCRLCTAGKTHSALFMACDNGLLTSQRKKPSSIENSLKSIALRGDRQKLNSKRLTMAARGCSLSVLRSDGNVSHGFFYAGLAIELSLLNRDRKNWWYGNLQFAAFGTQDGDAVCVVAVLHVSDRAEGLLQIGPLARDLSPRRVLQAGSATGWRLECTGLLKCTRSCRQRSSHTLNDAERETTQTASDV